MRIKQTSVFFCEYFRKQSSDLYEIWNLSSLDSKDLLKKMLWRSMYTQAHTRCKSARSRFVARAHFAAAHFVTHAHGYASFARVCEWIFMNFFWWFLTILWAQVLNFIKIEALVAKILAKQYWCLFNPWFSMYFAYFHINSLQKPLKMDNCWMIMKFFGN